MLPILAVTLLTFTVCDAHSLGTVSDKNVTKRAATPNHDLFPDWVPFKNKKGEELGEFVQVAKAKPKKRLALPTNFVLKAVAEPQEDYYDKGPADSDGDDYYEKKEWSDLNRPADVQGPAKVNHTDLSEIDGVVSIITKPNSVSIGVKNSNAADAKDSKEESKESAETKEVKKEDPKDAEVSESKETSKEERKVNDKADKKPHKYEDDVEYEDSNSEKQKPAQDDESDEKAEAEAKKAKILDSVDELKQRHAAEQRVISEKVKEEEIYKEEHERNQLSTSSEIPDKYAELNKKKNDPQYDDYDDKSNEKTKRKTTTRQPRSRTTKRKPKKEKHVEGGKLSVFKNPKAYIVYDDESTEKTTTLKPKSKTTKNPTTRFGSKFSKEPVSNEESERISLVPQDQSKDGEPTLFFPKKRKNKRRRKQKTTTPQPEDSFVAESIPDSSAKDLITQKDIANTTGSENVTGDTLSAFVTAPDAVPLAAITAPAAVAADAVPASSDHDKGHNYHHERGVDREHHSEHEEAHEEHGKKAYEGIHEDTKNEKGHHDKEAHKGKYYGHGGHEKEHHDEQNHYGAHHHEEHGKKHAKYEESGKHSKGHNTKGSHDIHKKEEYEKKVEFFEEDGDSAEEEKHGGHTHEREHKSGGHYKKGGLDAAHSGHEKGGGGNFAKGGFSAGHKGHRGSGGHDSHGQHHSDHAGKGGRESGKKWIFHHGHPAKSANLVAIDRRADQYQHGPRYFG